MSTGEEYIRAITRLDSDRRARAAFRAVVLSIAAPGTCIFDFGAGPGIDAKFYAQQGFRVVAYDVDARMCASFVEYCRPEMESRQVELLQGDYRHFLDTLVPAIRGRFEVSVITANFAPLNMIDDLSELFAKFHALTGSGTRILASVLHPYFARDMRYRWWWRNRPLLWRQGCFGVASRTGMIFRRSLDNFASQAAPYFTLEGVVRGLPGRAGPLKRASRLAVASSRYMFLLFARR